MGQLSAACGGISSLWIITDFLSCSHLSVPAQVLHYKKQQMQVSKKPTFNDRGVSQSKHLNQSGSYTRGLIIKLKG